MINNIYNKHLNYTFNHSKVTSSNFNSQFRGNISISNKKIFEVSENILSFLAIIKRFITFCPIKIRVNCEGYFT